ncbi:hypothetical protein Acav_1829 [Paracidovorax avenae ATCC 19860]|uniref:Uncharacterized protein n=1 Tax=Paracidovorax avenae (strain ATCC 19860 / DSM 7227 / CCUG 15838 / JCM 20985 / LMG 2117 / NCPPB 1011) TaxID=643561 RepID=F0Q772_PARA1|nr:hypothetical protein Acav_1829 [Paracidovorax avenae ATCC 19860]
MSTRDSKETTDDPSRRGNKNPTNDKSSDEELASLSTSLKAARYLTFVASIASSELKTSLSTTPVFRASPINHIPPTLTLMAA